MSCFEGDIATLRCIPFFFTQIISITSVLAAAAAVGFIIWGAIKFITSGGDQEKVKTAKKTISFALVGLIIVVLSFVIVKLVSTIGNVECRYLGIQC